VVIVDDDVAVGEKGGSPGRRGTAATVFVEKIAGALAAEGASLADVKAVAERVVEASSSIGFALTSCTTPMAGKPTFELGQDEIEFGVGIHGEQGRNRQPLGSAAELARQAVETLAPADGARVLAFTNGLGGTPESELYVFHGEVLRELRARGVEVERQLVGSYVTSLDMAGASLSLLVLDDELTRLWDAPVRTPAMRRGCARRRLRGRMDERRRGRPRRGLPTPHRARRRARRRRPRREHAARVRRDRCPARGRAARER
jgi:dihydroxyacetone kinase-like protein